MRIYRVELLGEVCSMRIVLEVSEHIVYKMISPSVTAKGYHVIPGKVFIRTDKVINKEMVKSQRKPIIKVLACS